MKVVTIATDLAHPFLARLLAPSCGAVGLDLVILHATSHGFRLSDKRAILTHYLTHSIAPDELILFTDAYDTMFVRGEQDIRTAYEAFPQPVVFSAEPNSWPLGAIGLALRGDPPAGTHPFLNSGGFLGPAGELLALCTRYPKPPSEQFPLLRKLRSFSFDTDERYAFSDQYHWTLVQLLEGGTVALDTESHLFENMGPRVADVWDLEVIRGIFDFRTNGRTTASYQRERSRLERHLRSPSRSGQIHFSNPLSKAAVLDMHDEGRLPAWLSELCPPGQPNRRSAQVVPVTA